MTISQTIGDPIPNHFEHAVSFTLPTWLSVMGCLEGEELVQKKLTLGYPRMMIHPLIQALQLLVETRHGTSGEQSFIFPTSRVAAECCQFIKDATAVPARVLALTARGKVALAESEARLWAVLFDAEAAEVAKLYWRLGGLGISSRMGSFYLARFQTDTEEPLDQAAFQEARTVLNERIANLIGASASMAVLPADVYLHPSGMAAIYQAHRALMATAPTPGQSVCYGFPFADTLKVLRTWGEGCVFLGFGDDSAMAELETLLRSSTSRITAIFCECPSNPLLRTPDLAGLRALADRYGLALVVDETIGTFVNVNVLPYADMVVSSLTKLFSGASDVLAGSLVLNPQGPRYAALKEYFNANYESECFFGADAVCLERNSRDFVERSLQINDTAALVADLFAASPLVNQTFYPALLPCKRYYDAIKTPSGGYGCLLTVVFHRPEHAMRFYDALEYSKGPSLGTNFTLAAPYAQLAHVLELEEVARWGVDRNLVRISVGLEPPADVLAAMSRALAAALGGVSLA